jgi:hypothetical protein
MRPIISVATHRIGAGWLALGVLHPGSWPASGLARDLAGWLPPPPTATPREVDLALAAWVRRAAPSWLPGLALCWHHPDARGPAGGIIGCPGRAPHAATARWEPLPYGLWQHARAGGPGVITTAPCPAWHHPGTLRERLGRLRQAGINLALAVADGCGPRCRPGLAVLDPGGIRVFQPA